MCGIAGILRIDGMSPSTELVKKMCDIIKHRGPDSEGFYNDSLIALGHRRLKIIDMVTGKQPMCNEDGTIWITYNGEIYNYKELKNQLLQKGHRFETNTDTEVIIHLYEEMGEECVHSLRGMFAFAIWDKNQRKLFAARDRLGIKPFYYYYDNKQLIFASEIKAVIVSEDVKPELNNEALIDHLRCKYPLGTKTFFKNVLNLSPGWNLTWENGRLSTREYWDISFSSTPNKSEKEYIEGLQYHLQDAITSHLISDVPVGAFLSGGLDSGTIVALASENKNTDPIKTFCCGSKGWEKEENSDIVYAKKVASFSKSQHYEILLSPREYGDFIPKAIWHLDEPGGGDTAIPGYFVAKYARENVTVLLSGEGGDEILGGYRHYIQRLIETSLFPFSNRKDFVGSGIPIMKLVSWLPEYLRLLNSREKFSQSIIYSFFPKDLDSLLIRPNFDERMVHELLNKDFLEEVKDYNPVTELYEKYFKKDTGGCFVDKMQYIDMKTYLYRILHIYDRMCMAVSLENRVPFLDYKLVEFASSIPCELRFKGLISKYLLRKAIAGKLPPEVINRKKAGFSLPAGNWFRNELKDDIYQILFGSKAINRGIFNRNMVQKVWDEHQKGIEHTQKLWSLISIELWHQIFIDGKSGYE
ncbi:MAG: asparagine synthase (glutamine-hydrolyzing) [Candidatus Desantisbacteria bacterium]